MTGSSGTPSRSSSTAKLSRYIDGDGIARLPEDEYRTILAELESLRDVTQRLICFDGGAEVMDWLTRHRLHKDEPYIGCPFCRPAFVSVAEVAERLREHGEERIDGWSPAINWREAAKFVELEFGGQEHG